jgi:outer membrane protein OmpA-like peptidoglycan-associated protein
MKSTQQLIAPISAITIILAMAGSGCATKKFVRQTVSPIEQRAGELEKKTTEHASSIEELEKGVSRADERAMTADSRATAASQEAARAHEQASLAGKGAEEARTLAEKGMAKTDEVEQSLSTKIENADNYQLTSTDSVLFKFNHAALTPEASEQLDAIAQKVSSMKHYVIEVQGFTDRTGSQEYNLELSRRRAATVVRYLTVQHKIPLHRIHVMGYGAESPASDNSTRDGRKQNRRTEIRTFVAAFAGSQVASAETSSN